MDEEAATGDADFRGYTGQGIAGLVIELETLSLLGGLDCVQSLLQCYRDLYSAAHLMGTSWRLLMMDFLCQCFFFADRFLSYYNIP